MLNNIFSQSVLFQALNGKISSPVNLKDHFSKYDIHHGSCTWRLHHIYRSAFKPIVLFQDKDTKQEKVSHTADTTGESNSLATGKSMVSVFCFTFL